MSLPQPHADPSSHLWNGYYVFTIFPSPFLTGFPRLWHVSNTSQAPPTLQLYCMRSASVWREGEHIKSRPLHRASDLRDGRQCRGRSEED